MNVTVIDGQGGKLGKKLVEELLKIDGVEIKAIGTNYAATAAMMKAGAKAAATGENAVIVAARKADVIIGPVGIAIADSLMGEISPAMANAVAASDAHRVLIPMNLCSTYIAGVTQGTAQAVVDAMEYIKKLVETELDK